MHPLSVRALYPEELSGIQIAGWLGAGVEESAMDVDEKKGWLGAFERLMQVANEERKEWSEG